jgi:subfamily B ATP-binding cassette protein MsbA
MRFLNKIIDKYFRHFGFFYSYVGPRLFIIILLSILVGLLDGFGLALFIPIFEIAAEGSDFKSSGSMGELDFLLTFLENIGFSLTMNSVMIFMIVLFFVKAIFRFTDGFVKIKLQNEFVRNIRYQMVDGLSDLDYKQFLKMDSGRIQNTLSAEALKLTYGFLAYFNSLQHAILLLVYIGLAFLSNYQFAILVSLGGYLSNFVFRYLFKNTEKASIHLSGLGHSFQSYLIQAVHNFKYLKATNYFSDYKNKLKNVIDQIEINQRKIGIYGSIMTSAREPIILTVVVLIIFIQVELLEGTLSSVALSLVFLYRALNYIVTLQGSWQGFIANIGGVVASVDLIKEFGDNKEVIVSSDEVIKIETLSLEKIAFIYPNGAKVLEDVQIVMEPLKTYAFVGESGSGKTTLVNLLIGLVHPSEGRVLVNRIDRKSVDLLNYRKRFGYITQEPVIFNDTIFNNVTLWASKSPENIIRFDKAVQLASMSQFMNELPDQEDTRLGDNGLLVSGGQKQRISIARELFKDVDVLIFDEATSALDSETECLIQDNIDMLMGRFTIVIIAHRLSTIRKADVITLMSKGKVVQSGDFKALLSSNHQFKRMVELQEF